MFKFKFVNKGFDTIASAGEEVKNPKKNIPIGIVLTLIVVTLLYCALSAVLSLMVPYYLLNPITPFPFAFNYVNLQWASNFVSIGAILSLITVYENNFYNLYDN
jgi:APA family basic amino acid/polyamine antiporter